MAHFNTGERGPWGSPVIASNLWYGLDHDLVLQLAHSRHHRNINTNYFAYIVSVHMLAYNPHVIVKESMYLRFCPVF